jgi:hypothetical protein
MVTFLANPDVQQAFDGISGEPSTIERNFQCSRGRIAASHPTNPWTEPILDT